VPGVVLLEAVLEVAAELLGREPVVAQLAQAKFLAPLLPGQDASIEIALHGQGDMLDFRVLRAGSPLAQGRFVLRDEVGA
jgi:3-hydroxymyristoyl/3-hydroxydecanoyl-(acyl carrier protein) dehydratase